MTMSPNPNPVEAPAVLGDAATPDPVESARAAGLRYVQDDRPGIRREKISENNFRYFHPDGNEVTDEDTLARIRSLGIPPAYTDVWICPIANGHLQATGRDARGRKQYRYHPRFRETRDETKYGRMVAFGDTLPQIRARIEHDLGLPGLPREKVLAAVVRLLQTTLIRVGNDEYARQNQHYGLTTMHNEHVEVKGSKVHFDFVGKSGKERVLDLKDPRIARIVKKCQDLPGQDLFVYVDDEGNVRDVSSQDVNDYLREITGEAFTAKDFRTWAGTLLCTLNLRAFEPFETQTQAKKNVVQAIKTVAEQLGNTPAVCRKSYVHPAVLNRYVEGSLIDALMEYIEDEVEAMDDPTSPHALDKDERAVMGLLRKTLQTESTKVIAKTRRARKKAA